MPIDPLGSACLHIATPQEKERDPDYFSCDAGSGEPCLWAKRYDGIVDPLFHSERIESSVADASAAAASQGSLQPAPDRDAFRNAVLDTGLV